MRQFLMTSLAITTCLIFLMEITMGFFVLFGYVFPYFIHSLIHSETSTLTYICLFYIILMTLNYLAISCILLSMISGFMEKWFSYEKISAISITLLLVSMLHSYTTNFDPYKDFIVKEMYKEVVRYYDFNKKECLVPSLCMTAVKFHQRRQCCGWENYTYFLSDENSKSDVLPQFCCAFVQPSYHLLTKRMTNCTDHSMYLFKNGCKKYMILENNSFDPTNFGTGFFYLIIKMYSMITYIIAKRMHLIPTGEGVFAHFIPK